MHILQTSLRVHLASPEASYILHSCRRCCRIAAAATRLASTHCGGRLQDTCAGAVWHMCSNKREEGCGAEKTARGSFCPAYRVFGYHSLSPQSVHPSSARGHCQCNRLTWFTKPDGKPPVVLGGMSCFPRGMTHTSLKCTVHCSADTAVNVELHVAADPCQIVVTLFLGKCSAMMATTQAVLHACTCGIASTPCLEAYMHAMACIKAGLALVGSLSIGVLIRSGQVAHAMVHLPQA